MVFIQAFILGIIQGLTEFLPVSSSAHLILIPSFLGWPEHTLFFDTSLHLGTALAVLIYFAKDWVKLIKDRKFLLKLLIGVFPAGIIGFLFDGFVEKNLRSTSVILITLIIGTAVMFLSEKILNRAKFLKKEISLKDSLFIGSMQVLALFPGMSRSGMTVSGGFFRKIEKEEALKFSFYLATPLIFAAAFYNFAKSYILYGNLEFLDGGFAVGFLTSFAVGLFAIKFMIEYIRRKGFGVFIAYRLFLVLLILFL